MFNPCVDYCWNRFGREYSKDCDNTCEFAKIAKELDKYKELFEKLYSAFDKYFNEYDGGLMLTTMKDSELICDLAAYDCSLILHEMMYERWISENPDSKEVRKWHTNKEK